MSAPPTITIGRRSQPVMQPRSTVRNTRRTARIALRAIHGHGLGMEIPPTIELIDNASVAPAAAER
jgi:hypothetical protein